MRRVVRNDHSLWQFETLEDETSVTHFVTDRNTRSGSNHFTLSYSNSSDPAEIRTNRKMLAASLDIDETQLFFPRQVHKTKIVVVNKNTMHDDLVETDALITNEKRICIAIMSADCVPVLLYDSKNKAIGAVHSGWRGTVQRILEKTLLEMHLRFGTVGTDLIACIGPSVCQDSYEVGEEVIDAVHKAFGAQNNLLIPQPGNKAKLDLWKANEIQLSEFGVPSSRIELSNLCTIKNNHHFFSARKGDTGRFGAGIMLV